MLFLSLPLPMLNDEDDGIEYGFRWEEEGR